MPVAIYTITPASIIIISDSIKRGNTIRNSCQLIGLTPMRYHEIMKTAKAKIDKAEEADPSVPVHEEDLHIMFYRAVKASEAILEDSLVDTWFNLRHTDWKAARDLLAARFPKDWNPERKKAVTVSGPGGGPVQVQSMDLSKLTTEELENFERLLAKVPQSGDDTDGED